MLKTRNRRLKHSDTSQSGFTIIELMIATAVLSTILLLVTVLMISIGNLYYKGISQTAIQDDARTITNDVAQQLQLNTDFATCQPSSVPSCSSSPSIQAYCIGDTRYTYVLGAQISQPAPGTTSPAYAHILWRDSDPTPGTSCTANTDALTDSSYNGSGTELVSPNSRLTEFSISGSSPYSLTVGLAYGSDDLFCNPLAVGNSCNPGASAMSHVSDFTGSGVLCKGSSGGDQFCGTADLSTTVVSRLSGS